MSEKRPRGLATMTAEERTRIARLGGVAAHKKGAAHEFTSEEAATAGKKGGAVTARDREHMARIGRRGGETVSRDREHMAEIGRKGGAAVSSNRVHMAEMGRKGGSSRAVRQTVVEISTVDDVEERDEAMEAWLEEQCADIDASIGTEDR